MNGDYLTSLPPATALRTWHRRGQLPYLLWCDAAEDTFRHVPLIPTLLERWTRHGPDELDDRLVDWTLDLDGVRHHALPADANLERFRASKLILDAARELYHIAALTAEGAWAHYRASADLRGVDVHVAWHGEEWWLQLGMRARGCPNLIDDIKDQRGNRSDIAMPVIFNTAQSDRSCQPFVPTADQYRYALKRLGEMSYQAQTLF